MHEIRQVEKMNRTHARSRNLFLSLSISIFFATASSIGADEIETLVCKAEGAYLKTGEIMDISGDFKIVFSGDQILNEDELCVNGLLLYNISETEIFGVCRRAENLRDTLVSRETGRFTMISSSIEDPSIYIKYQGTCSLD